jgi:hypothetical protein
MLLSFGLEEASSGLVTDSSSSLRKLSLDDVATALSVSLKRCNSGIPE